ncbi:MAG: hypothetical protein FJ272_08755 [Planctomycetes bacterium]|nr:hypothetical protein [Planctomycetota bacterium]
MRELKQDWRDLFLGFRIALDAKKILLGAAGVALSVLVICFLAFIFKGFGLSDTPPEQVADAIFAHPSKWAPGLARAGWRSIRTLQLTGLPQEGPPQLARIVWQSVRNGIEPKEAVGFAIVGIILLVIWSLFGGGITRIAAVDLAKDERIELAEATKFSAKKFWSYFWSPIVLILGIVFFALCNILGGLVGRIPFVGELLVAIGLPLAFLSGFLIVLILVGLLVGLGLMFPTISAEGTDAFDAISRAYSYVYSKPWRFIWLNLVATAYGIACIAFVMLFTCLMTKVTLDTGHIGMGKKFDMIRTSAKETLMGAKDAATPRTTISELNLKRPTERIAAYLVLLWLAIVLALGYGYAVSFCFSSDTITYFLMRKAVDGTDVTEVYMEEEEEEAKPTAEPPKPAEAPKPEGAAPAAPTEPPKTTT